MPVRELASISDRIPTLLVVPNKYELPNTVLKSKEHRKIIPDLDLARFIDYHGVHRDQTSEIVQSAIREHAECA
jgi:hypothetical protein